jgi:hypothetical protein
MCDELAIPSRTDNFEQFRQVLIAHGGPAFLRRASEVNAAYEHLLDACRQQRKKWLAMVSLRLATLHARAGSWNVFGSLLEDDASLEALQNLYAELSPRLRCETLPTQSESILRKTLEDLIVSIENFNRRWLRHLRSIDFSHINKLREGYNRYYVLEKECAVRSGALARKGFQTLEMLQWEHLLAVLPLLPVPGQSG